MSFCVCEKMELRCLTSTFNSHFTSMNIILKEQTITSYRKLKSRSGFRLADDLCGLTAALLDLMFVLSITGVTLGLFCVTRIITFGSFSKTDGGSFFHPFTAPT